MKAQLSETGFDSCAFLDYDTSNDFYLYEIGNYNCPPGYGYGPAIRSRSIFHFVISGEGTLYLDDKEYKIKANEGFLIPANKVAYYEASIDNPWSYIWFHIGGSRLPEILYQAGLDSDNPVFSTTQNTARIKEIYDEISTNRTRELYCIGKLYELFDYMTCFSQNKVNTESNLQLEYVKKSIKYIQLKYSEPIHVDDIADACGLNRSYLSRLFKAATGNTLQQYLISYRMKMAVKLMKETSHSIQHISFAVGYNDVFTFSKAFKKHHGVAPTEYLKTLPRESHITK